MSLMGAGKDPDAWKRYRQHREGYTFMELLVLLTAAVSTNRFDILE